MSDNSSMVDQRRSVRFAVDLQCEVASDAWQGTVPLRLTNLSLDGAFVETDLPLHIGSELVLVFNPDGEHDLRILAEVRRVELRRRRAESTAPRGMAVSFAYVGRGDRASLQRWLTARTTDS